MTKPNATLNKYITQLPIVGVLYLVVSLSLSYFAYRDTQTTSIFIPFILGGAGIAYYLTTFMGKGGNVNYYFTPHTLTENEKALNTLIEKHRDSLLMTLFAFGVTAAELFMVITNIDESKGINFDYFIGGTFMSFITIAGVCQGIKFLTAWWNIKRNWKKEFMS